MTSVELPAPRNWAARDLEDPKMIRAFWLDFYKRNRMKFEEYRRKMRLKQKPRG